jgi:multiple sugar transport system ATP-binding protein
VARVAERLGLAHLLRKRPRQLSGGDQQRVGLARAIVRRPAIWLMDEPLGTLDADRRGAMCEFLREQQLAARVTTVYVTHDQEEAMRLADRIVVMREGRIEQAGPPIEVYDRPASLFVAHFVGSPGMNFVPGRVTAGAGALAFRAEPGGLELAWPSIQGGSTRSGRATLGVRPEHLRVGPRAESGTWPGRVAVDEYLGGWRCLHVDTAAGRLVARVAPDAAARRGAEVGLEIDAAHACLFDPEQGGRLA